MRFDGDDAVLIIGVWLVVRDAHHERDGGAVEIAVEQADLEALFREGDGEVRGDGGLTNAAFSRTHGNDAFNSRDGGGAGASGSSGGGWALNIDVDLDLFGSAHQGVEDLVTIGEKGLRNFGISRLNLDLDGRGISLDAGGFDEAKRNNISGKTGVFYFAESIAEVVAGHGANLAWHCIGASISSVDVREEFRAAHDT